jgi:glycosyltransferase involved in cell wall biosynthesis
MSPKTIAVIGLTHPFRGGIAHYTTLFVRELRKAHHVVFFALTRQYPTFLFPGKTQYDDSQHSIVETHTACIDSINPWTWIKSAWRLKKASPDLVVIQWWHPFFGLAFGTIANLLAYLSNIKVCFLCHNVLPHESTVFDRLLLSYVFWKANYFIVHSEEDQKNLIKLKPEATIKRNIHPSYSIFGDFETYSKCEARQKLGLTIDKKIILFFGLIRKYKGLQYLIRAMPDVIAAFDCTLLIAGEFYDAKTDYMELIDACGVGDHTIIVDQYISNEDVSAYFCSADVVILPYVDATQSGIVQIAFGLHKPVITTRVGGLPEAVDHGHTGLLVDKESPKALAEAIIHYYTENCEATFSQEIVKRAMQFGWDHEIRNIEAFMADTETTPSRS